jgi:hypothetical protein
VLRSVGDKVVGVFVSCAASDLAFTVYYFYILSPAFASMWFWEGKLNFWVIVYIIVDWCASEQL